MKKPTYKIVEGNPEGCDPKDMIIEKSNVSVEFTLRDMERDQAQGEKYLREFNAQLALEKSKIENFLHHYPILKELTPEQIHAAFLYQQAAAIVKSLEAKIPELQAQYDESVAEENFIIKKLKIAMPSPFVPPAPVEEDEEEDDQEERSGDVEVTK